EPNRSSSRSCVPPNSAVRVAEADVPASVVARERANWRLDPTPGPQGCQAPVGRSVFVDTLPQRPYSRRRLLSRRDDARMALTLRKLHPHFVAEVSPVDLRRVHDGETLAEIRAGMDEFAVLVFRDQPFTDDEQLA